MTEEKEVKIKLSIYFGYFHAVLHSVLQNDYFKTAENEPRENENLFANSLIHSKELF